MKKTAYLFLLFTFLVCSGVTFANEDNASAVFKVNAGHGYAEPYDPYGSGIRMQERGGLSSWINQQRKVVWYLYQQAGTYELSFNVKSEPQKDYKFQMKTSPCYDGLNYQPEKFDFSFSLAGNKKSEVAPAFTITIPTTGYYRYELTAKSNMEGLSIDELLFKGIGKAIDEKGFETHATDYLSSPSVHLGFSTTAPTSKQYDWLYEEILVPEGFDPLSTFWMSIGFFRGYLGIQANSDTERRVLFSAWDAVDKDKYPNAPKEMLVRLVDKAEYTRANSFGNEGTGGQSYVGVGNVNTWKTGTPVKFLMNCRRDGSITYQGDVIKHSIISAWYDAGEGWRYIASWRVPVMPGGKDTFDGFYSFLENYGFRNGQIIRKGYYYNAFGKDESNGKWTHFNKVRFSNTDGKMGQRIDYEQGVSGEHPDKFYMVSGGYGTTKKTENEVPLINSFPYLENLDLTPFVTRVDVALVAEKQAKAAEEKLLNLKVKDKSAWKVVAYTTEEIVGEGSDNGRAGLIIDGDANTYWHSEWTGKTKGFPHRFVVDLGKKEKVNGFRFFVSGGAGRFPKEIMIEYSDKPLDIESPEWKKKELLHVDAPAESIYILELDKPAKFRYFRLSVLNGYNDEVYTRINEVDVF
ncbi:DUF3472 domain-containing protein [Paludibacter sp. 221]|uniref:DUF3472 domain-containing protein n=1 Tax=Paludibacter sp. 221 TaxID=2302939 RepID=UPI0013D7808A|nr:DUF3472 domain-containing protein [Paludibacter sp. 221]NDV46888.1 DUF3472 domain-containing protein [Paludibacter sp. 221]